MSQSTLALLCKEPHCPSTELPSPSQSQTLNPLNVTPLPLPFSGNHLLLSISMDSATLGTSYKRNHTIFFLCSVQFSHSVVSDSLWPHEPQHARPLSPSPTPGFYPNSCSLTLWCHPTISSSVVPFSSCLQSFPASESFQMSQLLRIRWPKDWSFSLNISPSNEHPGLISFMMTGWISLQSKGPSRVFSNTTVQKHQFFSAQLSS